jgi:vitamin B12 transporter
LIDFDPDSFTNINRNEVQTSGAELQVNWWPSPAIQFLAHATCMDIDVKGSSIPLTGRPKWVAGATTIRKFQPDWSTALDYHWTGDQHAASRHSGESVMEVLDDFHRVDMNLAWQATDSLRLEFAVDNLLDERSSNAVSFPVPGRGIRISLSLGINSS